MSTKKPLYNQSGWWFKIFPIEYGWPLWPEAEPRNEGNTPFDLHVKYYKHVPKRLSHHRGYKFQSKPWIHQHSRNYFQGSKFGRMEKKWLKLLHKNVGTIFIQLWPRGRISHSWVFIWWITSSSHSANSIRMQNRLRPKGLQRNRSLPKRYD